VAPLLRLQERSAGTNGKGVGESPVETSHLVPSLRPEKGRGGGGGGGGGVTVSKKGACLFRSCVHNSR